MFRGWGQCVVGEGGAGKYLRASLEMGVKAKNCGEGTGAAGRECGEGSEVMN